MPVLRAATFNLLHGLNPVTGDVRESDLRSAAEGLDADLLALQEVDREQARSGHVDQTAVVADALGAAHWRFEPSLRGVAVWCGEGGRPMPVRRAGDDGRAPTYGEQNRATAPGDNDRAPTCGEQAAAPGDDDRGPAYGLSLVSRWPVREWHVRRFPPAPVGLPLLVPAAPRPQVRRVPDEPRIGLIAVVEGPTGPITVIATHLSFVPGYNIRQLRTLVRDAARFPRPRLLLGDLNLIGRAPARITGWRQLARVSTYPSYRPRVQFDHVLGDGIDDWTVAAAIASALPVSDHCGLVVPLRLPAGARTSASR
jgi:endonuclease/exonuclease/phosphatase family metal-dependent hydrolase